MTATRIVDALGTHCPVPVRLLALAAGTADPGTVIELLADDPLVEIDVPAWCHSRSHRILATSRQRGMWTFTVAVGDAPDPRPAEAQTAPDTG
jgi:TusA-related sulfurtransferase